MGQQKCWAQIAFSHCICFFHHYRWHRFIVYARILTSIMWWWLNQCLCLWMHQSFTIWTRLQIDSNNIQCIFKCQVAKKSQCLGIGNTYNSCSGTFVNQSTKWSVVFLFVDTLLFPSAFGTEAKLSCTTVADTSNPADTNAPKTFQ